MPLSNYVARVKKATDRARSEAKLEGDLNHILGECLAEFGINFDPHVNETLSSMGLAQVDAHRPDGVFGHIVYDYNAPRILSVPRGLADAKAKIETYLDSITRGTPERQMTAASGSVISGTELLQYIVGPTGGHGCGPD